MKKIMFVLPFIMSIFLLQASVGIASNISDPPPVIGGTVIMLHKELSGYKSYGEEDGAVDILRPGEAATWNFSHKELILLLPTHFVIRGILDDKYENPTDDYSIKITIGKKEVFNGSVGGYFEHGKPRGANFTNWKELQVPAYGEFKITIENTSKLDSSSFMAFDWIRLLTSVEQVPEFKEEKAGDSFLNEKRDSNAIVATNGDPLVLREGPSTANKIVAKAANGEKVEILFKDDTEKWYYVRLKDGTMGYAYSKYIKK